MHVKFTIMHKNEKMAFVEVDGKTVNIVKYSNCIWQPFHKNIITIKDVYEFLEDRCYEDGRSDLNEILSLAGITENNPWEWCKISHGVTFEDCLWIEFEGESLTWEEVKIR